MKDNTDAMVTAVRRMRDHAVNTVLNIPGIATDDPSMIQALADRLREAKLVNIDHMYQSSTGKEFAMDDMCVCPPFENCLLVWHDESLQDEPDPEWDTYGVFQTPLTFLLHVQVSDVTVDEIPDNLARYMPMENVRWIGDAQPYFIFDTGHFGAGNRSIRFTADENGKIINFGHRYSSDNPNAFMDGDEESTEHMFMGMAVAFNFMNCRNVVVVDEPTRSRHQAKRVKRAVGTFSEIHVLPSGTTRRDTTVRTVPVGAMPMHGVRGHFAHYGPKYGRALLFGKIEGKFWIPQHARGDGSLGTIEQSYTVEAS